MKANGQRDASLRLTETYGPAVVNDWHDAWDAAMRVSRRPKVRQGVRYALEAPTLDPAHDAVSATARRRRGQRSAATVMKGYLANKAATDATFGGWFTAISVMHPDGYIQIKDRSKDIIISGGENIS